MGYTTSFEGSFTIEPPLKRREIEYLQKFNQTRRMKRNAPEKFGVEGEYFVEGRGFMGQEDDESVIDHNTPPCTQPSLWCQWTVNDNGSELLWDEGEKFSNYIEWLHYLINNFFEPSGYKLIGLVKWEGEDRTDTGEISVVNNTIFVVDNSSDEKEIIIPKQITNMRTMNLLTN